ICRRGLVKIAGDGHVLWQRGFWQKAVTAPGPYVGQHIVLAHPQAGLSARHMGGQCQCCAPGAGAKDRDTGKGVMTVGHLGCLFLARPYLAASVVVSKLAILSISASKANFKTKRH